MADQATIFVEGFLLKKGHMRHNWKIRWFKLSKSSLRYYTDKNDNIPHGRICLNGARLYQNKNTEFSERENVFMVTTSSGIEYLIQAPTSAEYKVWVNAVQKVIDSMSPEKSGTSSLQKLQHSRVINSSLASDELYKAEMFGEMRQSQPGILAHSKTIEGILYDQVVSGIELRRWCEKTLGIRREEAEEAIQSLVQIGFIDCLTSKSLDFSLLDNTHYFRLLADETSILSMSSSYLCHYKTATLDSRSSRKKNSISNGSGLPLDLPPGDVRKRGILFKRGHIVPSWKARCFVLQEFPATLSYFDPAKRTLKTINSLSLQGASAFAVTKTLAETKLKMNNPPDHLFCLKTANGAIYPITAATENEKFEWIEAISSLSRKKRS